MRIQLITPAPLRLNNGNKITALRWARITSTGHQVIVRQSYDGARCDLLIALHARRSYPSIEKFHRLHPELPLFVVLTGTDLYRDIRSDGNATALELATRLVALQKMALIELPRHLHAKTRVIYQSAEPYRARTNSKKRTFEVCLIGHLREEKDPLRAALAARRLPPESRIRVVHLGLALDPRLEKQARAEGQPSLPLARRAAPLEDAADPGAERSRGHHVTHGREFQCFVGSAGFIGAGRGLEDTRLDRDFGQELSRLLPVGNTQRLANLLRRSESDKNFIAVCNATAKTVLSSPPQTRARRVAQFAPWLAQTKAADSKKNRWVDRLISAALRESTASPTAAKDRQASTKEK